MLNNWFGIVVLVLVIAAFIYTAVPKKDKGNNGTANSGNNAKRNSNETSAPSTPENEK